MKRIANLLVAAMCVSASAVLAGDCCQKCGCEDSCRKVCRAVPDVKKVKKTVWTHECHDICLPGRTHTRDCEPTCGRVRTVKVLMKKEVTCDEPSWKWVVETVCDKCCPVASDKHAAVPSVIASEAMPELQAAPVTALPVRTSLRKATMAK